MSENSNLKLCPFCGGESEIKNGQDIYDKYIMCKTCGCRTKTFNEYFNIRDYTIKQMKLGKVDSVCEIISEATVKKAIAAWNRRACSCKKNRRDRLCRQK